MKRVLITGMSGTGKSSVLSKLRERGFKTVDTDYGGWTEQVDIPPKSDGGGDLPAKEWLWREDRMAELLSTEDADVLFVSGTARNQAKFYARFDLVVLLTAPGTVMTERLTSRTNNPVRQGPGRAGRGASPEADCGAGAPASRRSRDRHQSPARGSRQEDRRQVGALSDCYARHRHAFVRTSFKRAQSIFSRRTSTAGYPS